MQIEVSFAISGGTAESDALPLLTLEIDAQPSIETLGLGLADAKALLTRLQAQIVTRQVQLMSTSKRRCDGCGLYRALKDYHDVHYRSLFGSVVVKVPRWRRCECRCSTAPGERRARRWISAELEYVQSRLAAHDSVCQGLGVTGAAVAGGCSQRYEHGATAHAGRW